MQVDVIVLDLFEKASKAKYPVMRAVIRAFGRSAKVTLLDAATTSGSLKQKPNAFMVGDKWIKKITKRHNLVSNVLHGEAGSVDTDLIKKGMNEVCKACKKYQPARIFNVDETGLFWKLMPKLSYLSTSENRKTARGTKNMHFNDRVSAFMCADADGSAKVDMAIIGKAKNPRCFRDRDCPLKYFSQANAWSDAATFLK